MAFPQHKNKGAIITQALLSQVLHSLADFTWALVRDIMRRFRF